MSSIITKQVAVELAIKIMDEFSRSNTKGQTASSMIDDAVSQAKKALIRKELDEGSTYRAIISKYGFSPELIALVSGENSNPFID